MVSFSCKSKNNKINNNTDTKPTVDTTTFYDLKNYFNKEINDVKLTPYFIYTIITKGESNKKDSFPIKTPAFLALAENFNNIDITQKDLKPFYKESVYRDLSTKTININYSTHNKDLDIQGIDILLAEESNKVQYVFIRTNKTQGDSTILTQLNWKTGKSFLINKTIIKADGTKNSTQQYVNWNTE